MFWERVAESLLGEGPISPPAASRGCPSTHRQKSVYERELSFVLLLVPLSFGNNLPSEEGWVQGRARGSPYFGLIAALCYTHCMSVNALFRQSFTRFTKNTLIFNAYLRSYCSSISLGALCLEEAHISLLIWR